MNTLNPKNIKKYFKNQKPPDIQALIRKGEKFTDPYFPPGYNSLTSRDSKGKFVDPYEGETQLQYMEEDDEGSSTRIKWKRATEVYKKWQVFEGKIEFSDVEQGGLGDCYFVSSISALTEFPYLIKEKFRTDTFNEVGYYEVILFIDGEWQVVFLDDYFPWDPECNDFCYCGHNGKELWAMLLEKAWAKVNGGYSNIIAGIVADALQALTGFPTESLDHLTSEDPSDLFDKVENADKAGTIISSASKQENSVEKRGLVKGHAYTLIEAKQMEKKGIYLLKLRNPWGKGEWTGAWSDGYSKWDEETKSYFGHVNKDDGIFWIDIDNYIKYFDNTFICHLLYNSIIKSYFFEYEKYLKYPVIFNIQIKQACKTSFSILFKGRRFNRELPLKNKHPCCLVLCKYNKKREIEEYYSVFELKKDLNLVEDLQPGNYVLWAYCSLKDVTEPKDFSYSLVVSSIKDFSIEFIGIDQNFMLIQYLLKENYKRTGASNINASKEYFIGTDGMPFKHGLHNVLMYNKTNEWLSINASAKDTTKGLRLLPPYEGMKNFSILIPPKGSSAIVSIINEVSSRAAYNYNITSESKNQTIPEESKFEDCLHWEISNENDSEAMKDLRHDEFKFVSRDKVEDIPTFNEEELNKEIMRQSTIGTPTVTKDSLRKEYPFEMNYLDTKYRLLSDSHDDSKWDKIEIREKGLLYMGQKDHRTNKIHGKGILIYNNGNNKYIGFFSQGIKDQRGTVMDRNNNILYEGQYKNGNRHGRGKLVRNGGEIYEGEFVNNKMEGKGTYTFKNGDKWEGEFKDDKKNGIGFYNYKSGKTTDLVEYEDDHLMGKKNIIENQFKVFLDMKKKREEEKEKEEEMNMMKKIQEMGFNKFEQQREEKERQREKEAAQDSDIAKKFFRTKTKLQESVFVQEINKVVEVTEEEKRHEEYLSKIDQLKKEEPFMYNQVMELYQNQGTVDEFELLIYNKTTGERYLGNVNQNRQKHGRGAYFNGNEYYVGYFNNDLPNGYFLKYNKEKVITFKGNLDNRWNMIVGKQYHPNGDTYKGYFFNGLASGFGIYMFANGASWSGNFQNGAFTGQGKYFYDNGLITEMVTYNNNMIVQRTQYIREDYSNPNAAAFFNNISMQYPGVIQHILCLAPIKKIPDFLDWCCFTDVDRSIYIGQYIPQKNICSGRCCIIYPTNQGIKYYVGYVENKIKKGEGAYYDVNWVKRFEGHFKENKRNGYGHEYYSNGAVYAGYYTNDVFNGLGVFYWPNKIRVEGNYSNGLNHDYATIVNLTAQTQQVVKYEKGNIIEQNDLIYCKKRKYQKEHGMEIVALRLTNKEETEEFLSLPTTEDSLLLHRTSKELSEGVYFGEVNSIGFRHGRGLQRKQRSTEYYLGYFKDDKREGQGRIFLDKGKLYYEGNFSRDKPFGVGKYFFPNGERLEGNFNEVGEGQGTYFFGDGKYWQGTFYALMRNGRGNLFDQMGRNIGMLNYDLGRQIA